jgi:tetratricopeptide (TPR) repeat protein
MSDWLRPLLMLFYAPARGMAEVRDRAPLGRAALLALLAQMAHSLYMQWGAFAAPEAPRGAVIGVAALVGGASILLPVVLVFVPLLIFFANLFERRGSFGVVARQEFSATAATVFYAWAAGSLVAVAVAALLRWSGAEAVAYEAMQATMQRRDAISAGSPTPEDMALVFNGAAYSLLMLFASPLCLFLPWAVVAARQVFGLSRVLAVLDVFLSGLLSLPAAALLIFVFGPLLSSPFLLLLLFFALRGYFLEAARAREARAAFRQNLEAATLNPADATAHYQLGLIYVERRELTEARASFARAVEIDPEETDAHYQLGRIARAEGRHADAIQHFGEVVARDEAHAQHEVWREVGATYLAAGQFGDARDALSRFLARRPSDPEALYLMGRAHSGLGSAGEAREWMQRCIEAVRTAPAYKHRADRRWLDEAQQFLRTQA